MGSVKQKDEENIIVILAGPSTDIQNYKEEVLEDELGFQQIKEDTYDKLVKSGFEIDNAQKDLINKIIERKEKINKLKNKKHKLEKEYNNLLNSTSWRLTLPIRKVTGYLKRTH